jgi:hypothetical protein
MERKIPSEAFDFYASLGAARSYQAVADKYSVTKQAITKCATRERWQSRLEAIEARARERSDQKAVESVEEMNQRHLKMLAVVERKALEALRNFPMATAMEAVRALEIAMRQTRLIRGEPTERSVTSIEETIRREYERWMVPSDDERAGEPATSEQATPGASSDDAA